jgi:hypothetical protein
MFSRPEAAQATAIAMNGAQLNGRIIEVREERDLNAPRKKKSLRKPNPAAAAQQPPVVSGTAGRGGIGGVATQGVSGGGRAGAGAGATGVADPYGRLSINVTPSNVCFVSNLNWNSTDDDLFQHFCSSGVTPLSAKVEIGFYHNNGGLFVPHSKGWALVLFARIEDAAAAVQKLHKSELDGRKINVRFDSMRPPPPPIMGMPVPPTMPPPMEYHQLHLHMPPPQVQHDGSFMQFKHQIDPHHMGQQHQSYHYEGGNRLK